MNKKFVAVARCTAAVVEQMERRVLLAIHPLTDIPVLHSRPRALNTIYLDFNGSAVVQWDADIPPDRIHNIPGLPRETIGLEHGQVDIDNELERVNVPPTAAFSTDSNRTNFTDSELNDIRGIWSRVAEFFSPFDVDVTTVDPVNPLDDTTMRVIVGGDGIWRNTNPLDIFDAQPPYLLPRGTHVENGAAAFDSFADDAKDNVVFVFSDFMNSRKAIAETIGHQLGVAYGLHDKALWHPTSIPPTGPPTYEFDDSHDPGIASLGPIMGDPSGSARAVWWDGEVTARQTADVPPNLTHGFENELPILYDALGTAADDHDETFTFATPLTIGAEQADTQGTGASGTLEIGQDVDAFSFSTVAGNVSFTVTNMNGAGMLTPWLEIHDYLGRRIARATSLTGPSAAVSSMTISARVPEGSYTLSVFAPDDPGRASALKIRFAPGTPVPNDRDHFDLGYDTIGQYVISGSIPTGIVDDPFSGAMFVEGTSGRDRIFVTRDPDGKIRADVNGEITLWDPVVQPIDRVIVVGDTGPGGFPLGEREVTGGADRIIIGAGVPRAYILAGGGQDTVEGGDFNDTIVGGGGNKGNLLYGRGGDDFISGSKGTDFIFGDLGNDKIYGGNQKDELHGGAGNDRIYGNNDSDVIVGDNGNDTIYGNNGNDTIYGGFGNDIITGDPGTDSIFGQDGDDTFYVRDQIVDSIFGGAGTDSAQIDPIQEDPNDRPADQPDSIEVFIT